MGKIYNAPKEIKAPEFDFKNFNRTKYQEDCDRFEKELKEFLNKSGYNEEETGKTIRFQVADGYAVYMIASLKPVMLIHLQFDDEYSYEYAHRLTAKDIREKLRQQEALNRMFSKKK